MIPGLSLALLGGLSGFTPGPMNWADIPSTSEAGYNAAVQVTGISAPMLFRAVISSVSATGGVAASLTANVDMLFGGSVAVANAAVFDFTVRPLCWVFFSAAGAAANAWTLSFTVTIKYGATFSETLDTFTVALFGVGAGGFGEIE